MESLTVLKTPSNRNKEEEDDVITFVDVFWEVRHDVRATWRVEVSGDVKNNARARFPLFPVSILNVTCAGLCVCNT